MIWKLEIGNWKFEEIYAWLLIGVSFSAFLAFFLSLQAGVFALIFLACAWFVWEYPEEGFLLLIVLLPILPMLKITQTLGTGTLIKDVIIITLFVRVFLIPLLTKQLPYRRNILFAPIAALVLWSCAQTLRADSLILGVLRLRDIGLYILLYFAVLYLDHSKQHLRVRAFFTAIVVGIVALLGVHQWFFAVDSAVLRFDPVREIWIPRLSSVLAHPSILGEYLIAATSLFFAIAAFARNNVIRITSGFGAVLLLPVAFLTYSRGVWLGLAASIGILVLVLAIQYALKGGRMRKLGAYSLPAGITLLILGTLLLRFTPAGGLVRSAIDPTYASNEERIEFFVRLIAPLRSHEVLIGKGLGDVLEQNFRRVDLEVYDIAAGTSRSVQLTKNRTLVDNQYLKTFVELGVVGIVIYGWLYWRFAHGTILILKRNTIYTAKILALWGMAFLAAFILQALFIDIWDIFPTNAMFWIIAALVSAATLDSQAGKRLQ